MRPLIKKIQGALAVAFVGGCRLQPAPRYDGGVDDASTTDAASDAHDAASDAAEDVALDSPSDANLDDAGDASADVALD